MITKKAFPFVLFLLLTVVIVACSAQSAPTNEVPSTPVPTTEPLQAVEDAIWAANERKYDEANQLLDISAVVESTGTDAVIEHWNWIT